MKPHLGFLQLKRSQSNRFNRAPKKMYSFKIISQLQDDHLKEYFNQVSKRLKSRDSYPNALNVVITVIKLSQEITKMLTVYCRERKARTRTPQVTVTTSS